MWAWFEFGDNPYLRAHLPGAIQDYDTRLEPFANVLRPVVAKLEKYRSENGNYPNSLEQVGLSDSVPQRNWTAHLLYTTNGREYSVGAKLDFDDVLFYRHSSEKGGWFLNEDPLPDKSIEL